MLTANPHKIPKYLNCVLICAFSHKVREANGKCYSPDILLDYVKERF